MPQTLTGRTSPRQVLSISQEFNNLVEKSSFYKICKCIRDRYLKTRRMPLNLAVRDLSRVVLVLDD